MDHKQKAKDLVNSYINRNYKGDIPNEIYNRQIINQCLVAVNELIEESIGYLSIERNKYWKEVKKEIEKWYL